MIREEIEAQVRVIVGKELRINPQKIILNARLREDLGAHEVNIDVICASLEDDLGIIIPNSVDESLTDTDKIIDLAFQLVNK